MATTGLTTTTAYLVEWLWHLHYKTMKTYKNIYQELCSEENLELAFYKAQKGKSTKPDVIEFKDDQGKNLQDLRTELLLDTYHPKPLTTFIIRDPKTRKIRKSDFRDRIIHHAICNVLEPIFERTFIYDSFANRKGKGTLNAVKRFDKFKRKASRNNTRNCYVLKADIKHYFDEVKHNTLLDILRRKVKDKRLISLILKVLKNHSSDVGMPLGNMTSQFFANVYLNELDQFVKHELKAKYYIRYVDDFVILNNKKDVLEDCKDKINSFLEERLQLELHATKSKITPLSQGISFLGFRNYPHHRLLRKVSIRSMRNKILKKDYDSLCESFEGWSAYANHANTHKLRRRIGESVENRFPGEISSLQINRSIKQVECTPTP